MKQKNNSSLNRYYEYHISLQMANTFLKNEEIFPPYLLINACMTTISRFKELEELFSGNKFTDEKIESIVLGSTYLCFSPPTAFAIARSHLP